MTFFTIESHENLHPHTSKHVCESLYREVGLLTVSSFLGAHDETIANQLVFSNTLNIGNIADADIANRRARDIRLDEQQRRSDNNKDPAPNSPDEVIQHALRTQTATAEWRV